MTLNDLCNLENEVKVTQFEFGLQLALVLLWTKFGEDMSNISWDIEQKPSFISRHPKWPLTLKMRSRSPSSNLVFVLPWCFCVPNLARIHQIFLRYWVETILHMPAHITQSHNTSRFSNRRIKTRKSAKLQLFYLHFHQHLWASRHVITKFYQAHTYSLNSVDRERLTRAWFVAPKIFSTKDLMSVPKLFW